MNPYTPQPGDVGHADCPMCGSVSTTYAVTDVDLGSGDAVLKNVCAGLCDQCKAPVALAPGVHGDLDIRVAAPTSRPDEPPRLTDRALKDLERLEAQGWPRLAVAPARDLVDLRRKAEFVADGLLHVLRERKALGQGTWTLQHTLDDALDVVDALKRLERGLPLSGTAFPESPKDG